jgi:hypothetical protein
MIVEVSRLDSGSYYCTFNDGTSAVLEKDSKIVRDYLEKTGIKTVDGSVVKDRETKEK